MRGKGNRGRTFDQNEARAVERVVMTRVAASSRFVERRLRPYLSLKLFFEERHRPGPTTCLLYPERRGVRSTSRDLGMRSPLWREPTTTVKPA